MPRKLRGLQIAAEGTDDDLSELDEILSSRKMISASSHRATFPRLPDENVFTEEDFFTEDDSSEQVEPEAEATAYAHAVRSDDDYRFSACSRSGRLTGCGQRTCAGS